MVPMWGLVHPRPYTGTYQGPFFFFFHLCGVDTLVTVHGEDLAIFGYTTGTTVIYLFIYLFIYSLVFFGDLQKEAV
jgi:hypothetical protein